MGFFDKLKNGLNKTKTSFDEKINNVFSNFRKVDEEFLDELEEVLIMSDIGMDTSIKIISNKKKIIILYSFVFITIIDFICSVVKYVNI